MERRRDALTPIARCGERRRGRAALGSIPVLLLLLLGGALRFACLDCQSLWFDEGESLRFSSGRTLAEPFEAVIGAPSSERFQPLYFFLLHLWRRAFGDGPATVRSLSALCGLLALVPLQAAGRRLLGPRRARWMLGWLALSALLVYYSQEVRPYGLLLLAAGCQLALLARALTAGDRGAGRRALAFGAATGLAALASVFSLLFSAALAVAHLAAGGERRRWLRCWLAAALFSLPALAVYAASPVARQPDRAVVQTLGQPLAANALFVAYGVLVGTTYGPPAAALRGGDRAAVALAAWPLLLPVAAVAGVLAVFAVHRLRRRRAGAVPEAAAGLDPDRMFAVLLVVSFGLSLAFAAATGLNWQPRHSIALAVPVAALLSMPFAGDADRRRPLTLLARGAVIVLLGLQGVSLARYYFDPAHARDDYRAAAAHLERDRGGPAVLLWGSPELLAYYGAGPLVDARYAPAGELLPRVERATGGAARIRVVVNREFYWAGEDGGVERRFRPAYRLIDKVQFPYFTIYHFERRSAGDAAPRAGVE